MEATVPGDQGRLLPAVRVSLPGRPRSGSAGTSTAACPQVGQQGSCMGAGALELRPPQRWEEFLLQSRFAPGSSHPSCATDLTPEQGDTVALLCLQTPGLCSEAPPTCKESLVLFGLLSHTRPVCSMTAWKNIQGQVVRGPPTPRPMNSPFFL